MRLFLRAVRQRRWFKQPDDDWLEDNELKGDALSDINTLYGSLSVYTVSSESDRQRVAVALAATRRDFSNFDYVVFADSDVKPFGVTVLKIKGETPDTKVDRLHYELRNLTVNRLVQLATIIHAGEHKRIFEKDIKTLLHEAASTGQLNKAKVKSQKMRESLWP